VSTTPLGPTAPKSCDVLALAAIGCGINVDSIGTRLDAVDDDIID
jgi:hypothetical protein